MAWERWQNLRLHSSWCLPQATWRQRQRFRETARQLLRLPEPQEDPLAVLLSEAEWHGLLPPGAEAETVLAALSQETGIYFFPTREWVRRFCRLVKLLGATRVLEAGAGRGYAAAALEPALSSLGIGFRAVDSGQGEFESGLPRHPVVQAASAEVAVAIFRPDFILAVWPPPGQSLGPLLASPGVRYLLVMGESQGGCTGDPADWQRYPHRELPTLSRLGWGRSGRQRQAATLFWPPGTRAA
jgi:hypothetical protein